MASFTPSSASDRAPGATTASWRATVLTLYPAMFPGPLGEALAGRALAHDIWSLDCMDIRDYARDKHHSVDDAPFGGGPGMVMRPDVLADAIDGARASMEQTGGTTGPVIYLSPRGTPLKQSRVREIASGPGVTLICGRFEGVDERVLESRDIEEISVGDYVLSGGEIAALTVIDACVRLLPGVMGAAESLSEESFEHGLLEYPHYTRPRSFEGRDVPEVLLSGDHERIRSWRHAQAEKTTRIRRADLWAGVTDECGNTRARP